MAKRAMAAVYACRKQVAGLDDEESWRDFLEETTGKRSLRQMSGGELGRVIDGLHERGAVKKAGGNKGWRAGKDRPLADSAVAGKIRALWLSLWNLGALSDPSEDALASFVKRQAGVDDTRFLSAEDAHKVIEALKAWCAREGFEQPAAGFAATMNAWRRSAGLDPVAEGFAAKVAVIRTQWRKLEDAGAFDIGSMARLETFIRHEHGVSAPHFLEPRQADQVIASLGEWLRRKQAEIPAESERAEA